MNSLLRRYRDMPASGVDPSTALRVRAGTMRDYEALSRFHYRSRRPATVARIIAMSEGGGDSDEPVAVLVVSMPTLNGPWRGLAWPGVFGRDRRENARAANLYLRTISRLIVDPRWRGLGLAHRLVRAYLAEPITPLTESLAAMAMTCPFFAAAGMRAVPVPPALHNVRLGRRLTEAGLAPWQLLDGEVQEGLAQRPRLVGAIRTWARASRAHRDFANDALPVLALRAASALAAPRMAYVHGQLNGRVPDIP